MAPHLPAIAAACDVQTGRFIAIDSNQFDAAPLFAIAFTHNCKCGSPLWIELRSQTAVAWKSANGANATPVRVPASVSICPRPWENASEAWVDAPCFPGVRAYADRQTDASSLSEAIRF